MNKTIPYTREEFDSLVEEMNAATVALDHAVEDIYSGSIVSEDSLMKMITKMRNSVFREAIPILLEILSEGISENMESLIHKKEYLVKLTDSFIEKEDPYFILHIVKASDDSTIDYIPIAKSLLFS